MSESITTFTTNSTIRSIKPDDIGAFEGPKKSLKTFHIYHCINKKYTFQEVEQQPRRYVGFVLANNMQEAFHLSQNDFGIEYRKYKARSTSVGDIIQDDYGFYMVTSNDFKLVCVLEHEGSE